MPWDARSFASRHNRKLSPARAGKAARIANAVLRSTGDEGKAIRVANAQIARMGKYKSSRSGKGE